MQSKKKQPILEAERIGGIQGSDQDHTINSIHVEKRIRSEFQQQINVQKARRGEYNQMAFNEESFDSKTESTEPDRYQMQDKENVPPSSYKQRSLLEVSRKKKPSQSIFRDITRQVNLATIRRTMVYDTVNHYLRQYTSAPENINSSESFMRKIRVKLA